MKKFEKQLYNILNEKYLGEEREEKLTSEDKKSFLEAVANFHKLGEMIYSNTKLKEVTETLKSVMEKAEKVTMEESEHWFDNVTVSRHMKQMNEAMKVFEKTAGEMNSLQQRLESAYEDMGTTLNKYYKVNTSISEDGYTAGVDDGEAGKSIEKEDINISAKAFKKMNHNKLSKLAKKTDINIEEEKDDFTPTFGTGDVVHDCPKHVEEISTGIKGKVIGHTLNEQGKVNYIDVDYGGYIERNKPTKNFNILEGQTHEHVVKSEPKRI